MRSPFIKNACMYRLPRDFTLSREDFHEQLASFIFTSCGAQDMASAGWVEVAPGMLTIEHDGAYLINYCLQKKLLPANVINDEVAKRVKKAEEEQGRKVRRVERLTFRDEAIHSLTPRAFTREAYHYVIIDLRHQRVIVEAASATTAEDILALLRKTIGSLPVVPLMMNTPIELTLTEWLKAQQLPAGFSIGSDAVLHNILEDGGSLRASKQELFSDEITKHLEAGKLATAMGLHWRERISFRLKDDMTIKAMSFADELHDQNDDIDREDIHARITADFILFMAELNALLADLITALGGEYER